MAGTVLEVLSARKMALLAIALLLLQIVFFLIGGLVAPKPSYAQEHIMTNCVVKKGTGPQEVITRENCHEIKDLHGPAAESLTPDRIVLIASIPRPPLAMIPWFQYLLALLQVKVTSDQNYPCKERSKMLLSINVLYSDEPDYDIRQQPSAWKSLTNCEEERILECMLPNAVEGSDCDCDMLHLFQLGSVSHKYYLVNLRLPVKLSGDDTEEYNIIGRTEEMIVISIRQTGGFTKVWVLLKSALTVIVFFPIVWFWRRIRMLDRAPLLVEKAIFSLAISMLFLNLPIELVSIYFDAPWMLFFTDIRQGFFYAVLLSFWIIFLGEHLMDQPNRNKISAYKWQLGTIFTSLFALLVFDIAERGMQLSSPCTTVWTHHKIAMSLIIVASIGGILYFLVILYMVVKVFKAISYKRRFMLSGDRQKKFKSIIVRFRLLILLSVATAGLTVAFYILSQKYDGLFDDQKIEVSSAFFTGVYGLWNIYVLLILSAYAPSHKEQNVPDDPLEVDSRQELIALNSTDNSQTRITEQPEILQLTQQKTRED